MTGFTETRDTVLPTTLLFFLNGEGSVAPFLTKGEKV